MRKSVFRVMRLLSAAIFVALGVALLTGEITFADITGFASVGGVSMAFAAAAGYSQEGTLVQSVVPGSDKGGFRIHYDNDVSNEIVKMKPSNFPLDTILRQTNMIVPVKSWESEWYAVDVRATMDTLAAPVVGNKASDPISTWTAYTIKVSNPHMWSVDDNIRVHNLSITIAGEDGPPPVPAIVTPIPNFILHVVGKSGSDLSVIPVWPTGNDFTNLTEMNMYTMPPIATTLGVKLTRIGNAKAEKAAQTSPYAVFPEKFFNNCQVHMAQVEESVHSRLHKKEVPWDIYDYQTQSLYDMRRAAEFTSLFGVRGKIYDPTAGEWKFLSGGITQYITNTLTYYKDDKMDNPLFASWAQDTFQGNSGSDKRFLFAGSGLIKRLAAMSTIEKQIEAKSTEVVFGITFNKIETPFGVYLIKMHNLFNDVYQPDNGIIVDMNNIEKHVFKPMENRELEFIKSGQKMATGFVVDETFCVALKYPDTHRKIQFINSTRP